MLTRNEECAYSPEAISAGIVCYTRKLALTDLEDLDSAENKMSKSAL